MNTLEKEIEDLNALLIRANMFNESYGEDVLKLEIRVGKLKKEVAALRDFIEDAGLSTDRLDRRLFNEGVKG